MRTRARLLRFVDSASVRDLSTIAGTGVAVQLIQLVSGPLAARMLGPTGRGQFAVASLLTLLVAQLAVGGLPVAVSHWVAKREATARDVLRPAFRRWGLRIMCAASAAAAGTAVALRDELPPGRLALLVVAAFGMAATSTAQFLVSAMLRGEGNLRTVNRVPVLAMSVYVVGVAALFVLAPTRVAGVVATVMASAQALGLLFGWARLRRPGGSSSKVDLRALYRTARHSWFSSVSLAGLGIDQLVLGAVLGTRALGIYLVAVTVTSFPASLLRSVGAMLLARMSALPSAEAISLLRRWMAGAVMLDLGLVIGLEIVVAPVMRFAFGPDFETAIVPARIMIVAWALLALRFPLTAAMQAQGRTTRASVAEFLTALVLVAGVGLGAHLGGIHAAAFAQIVAGAFGCVLTGVQVSWRAPAPTVATG